jgi:hypothetical protein
MAMVFAETAAQQTAIRAALVLAVISAFALLGLIAWARTRRTNR